MIQKTYHITEYTYQKLEKILTEVEKLPAYRSSAQVLVLIMEQNWDKDCIREKTLMIRNVLPKAEVAGITHFDRAFSGEENLPTNNSILTFLFFENTSFSISRIPLTDCSEHEASPSPVDEDQIHKVLEKEIREASDMKCMLTLFACQYIDIERILDTENQDFPVIGATAGTENFFVNGDGKGYVFDSDNVYEDTLLYVKFFGKDLYVQASCNFGWTPVGKIMTVTKLKDPYTIAEIDHRPAAELYGKYLGIPWQTNTLSVLNICEFPLIVKRGDMHLGRIPFFWTKEGEIKVAITMHEGEQIRLSYGLPRQIFSGICADADALREFGPQGILMVICMNRMLFLHDVEHIETDAYRSIVPDAAFLHGNSEVFRHHSVGGEMH
ncbi:MAG: hypothetical protein IKF90_17900, partial [Parasporobacterium sp.]|nr:hypothetical protein [Parasporobacterium sp.]